MDCADWIRSTCIYLTAVCCKSFVVVQGEIDEAQELLEQVTRLQQEKNTIEKQYTSIKTVKRNIVCEVSVTASLAPFKEQQYSRT